MKVLSLRNSLYLSLTVISAAFLIQHYCAKEAQSARTGMRAMAVSLEPAVSQFIKAGDSVDILATFQQPKGKLKGEMVTATLLQNLRVIERAKDGTLNLEVSPLTAQYLALAQIKGKISVAVRETGDAENNLIEMASFQQLFH